MKFRDFEDDVKEGSTAEQQILDKFTHVFTPVLHRILYNPLDRRSVELQKGGVDGIINFKPVEFDVKSRRFDVYRFKDILLETKSVREMNTPGWLYKSNIVIYVWWNESKTKFVDGYILYLDKIRDWISGREQQFTKKIAGSKRNGIRWTTENIVVPIKSFPSDAVQQINRGVFREDTQVNLRDWFEGAT